MADAGAMMDGLRSHLVAEGIVRAPGDPKGAAPAPNLPVLWLEPEGGAVAPGDKRGAEDHPDVVVSVFHSGGIAAGAYRSFWRRDTLDFWLRCRRAPFAMELEAALRGELVGDLGRRDWSMGAQHVHATQEWRALQPAPRTAAPGHAFIWSLLVEYPA